MKFCLQNYYFKHYKYIQNYTTMTKDLRLHIEELYTKAIEHRSSGLIDKNFKDENQKKLQLAFRALSEAQLEVHAAMKRDRYYVSVKAIDLFNKIDYAINLISKQLEGDVFNVTTFKVLEMDELAKTVISVSDLLNLRMWSHVEPYVSSKYVIYESVSMAIHNILNVRNEIYKII